MTFRTRFAPSPTGPLHLGHAYSALLAHDMAQVANGQFLLRIEDIDQSRARAHWEQQIFDDLSWLGIDWAQPVMRQSDRMEAYEAGLTQLWTQGLLYPCTCSRHDIRAAINAPQEGAPLHGPDGLIYPGTCRPESMPAPSSRPQNATLRLNMARAAAALENKANASPTLQFVETGPKHAGAHVFSARDLIVEVGDVVLARRDMKTSYHLSVVMDDFAQGITHVVRGSDLFEATRIHVLLQALLGYETPVYHHHKLIRDDAGKRLAKRDDAKAIAAYRDNGLTPAELRAMVGLTVP